MASSLYWELLRYIRSRTGTGISDGDIFYAVGGEIVRLAVGTSNQVLTAQPGTAAKIAWAASTGGTGSGTSDHSALTNLDWLTSGHVTVGIAGTRVAGFTAGGTTTYFAIGTDIQAWDGDLDALKNLSGTGIPARTAANSWSLRGLIGPAAGLTITNPAGVAGNPTFALADDLAAVEGLSGTGIAVRTGASTWTTRTITATSPITVSDGDGVAAAPNIALTQTHSIWTDDLPDPSATLVSPSQEFQHAQDAGSFTNAWDVGAIGVSKSIVKRGLQIDIPNGGGGQKTAGYYSSTYPSGDFVVAAKISAVGGLSNFGYAGLGLMQGTGATDDVYLGGLFVQNNNGQINGHVGQIAAYNAGALTSYYSASAGWPSIYVLMRVSSGGHVTTFIGTDSENMTLADFDRTIGWTPTKIAIVGWGYSRKTRIVCPYIRVAADTYPGTTYDYPPRLSGDLFKGT